MINTNSKENVSMSKMFADAHAMLVRLVILNAVLDLFSILFWIVLPLIASPESSSTLNVNTTVAIVDAAVAAAVFFIAALGIVNKRKWGTFLAVAATAAQRVVGVFIFTLNAGMVVEIVWSVLIIYFAYREISQSKPAAQSAPIKS
jgi:hypothetical protein